MKTTAIILAITATALVASQFISFAQVEDKSAWTAWKMQYGKAYGTNSEESMRMAIFNQNSQSATELNNKNSEASFGTTQFADLTNAEFKAMYMGTVPKTSGKAFTTMTGTTPDSMDWRSSGAVSGVKNQGQCGSCWAFSTVGSVEGAQYLKTGTMKTYSEQDLVDCSTSYGNQGCNGGLMDDGFKYVQDHGLASEADYAYTGKDGSCQSKTRDASVKTGSVTDITNESDLRDAVGQTGPVSVAVCASGLAWQLYLGGTISAWECCKNLDHGVLAVAYDADKWTIKNSWGGSWGDKGYIHFKYGKNVCHLADQASVYTLA